MRLWEIIRDAEARSVAERYFKQADPNWDGNVSVNWIDRGYYGFVRCWSIKSMNTAFLVDPSLCLRPYDKIPLDTVARDKRAVDAFKLALEAAE